MTVSVLLAVFLSKYDFTALAVRLGSLSYCKIKPIRCFPEGMAEMQPQDRPSTMFH